MIDKLFICYETLSRFLLDLNAGNIKSTSIVFIELTHQIYTNGTYYGEFDNSIGPNGGLSNDLHLILSSDQIKWLFTTFANLNGLLTPWVEYTISYTGDKNAIKVNYESVPLDDVYISGGSRFDAHITVNEDGGYSQEMIVGITCTMGGESIAVDEVTGGWDIHISNVTGNIVIDVESTDKPYTYSIEDLDDGDESIVSSPALNERFAEGDEFQTTISIANGYEFTYVVAHMNGYVNPNTHNDVIYETSEGEVSSIYTIPEHEINVTGNINVQYHKRPKTYPINLGVGDWAWYRDAAQQEGLSELIPHTYGTDTVFYVFGNGNYNVTSVNVDVTLSDQLQYVDYDPNTGEVTISGECAAELTLSVTLESIVVSNYSITIPTGFRIVNGTLQPSGTDISSVPEGTTITFDIELDEHYRLDTAPSSGTGYTISSGLNNTYSVTINSISNNITISGSAIEYPKISYSLTGCTMTNTDSPSINSGDYITPEATYHFAITPTSGYELREAKFGSTDISSSISSNNTFDITVPNNAVDTITLKIVYGVPLLKYWTGKVSNPGPITLASANTNVGQVDASDALNLTSNTLRSTSSTYDNTQICYFIIPNQKTISSIQEQNGSITTELADNLYVSGTYTYDSSYNIIAVNCKGRGNEVTIILNLQ